MRKITVRRNCNIVRNATCTAGSKAWIEDAPEHWEAGRTGVEAIGKLIISHPKHFNITVTTLGSERPDA